MSGKIVKPEKPGGFLDYLPAEYLAREKMIDVISKNYRMFGFDPIETPRVEFLETLSGEESDTGKNIFYIESKQDTKKLALPFDHTVPFARLLAASPYDADNETGIRLPWRRMVCGPVFRGESPQSGRYRQFYQFDADIAGTSSMVADAEIIAMMHRTLTALGVDDFIIRVNNRKILNGLAVMAGIEDRGSIFADDLTREMMRILDKLDKIGIDAVVEELQCKPDSEHDLALSLNDETIKKIKAFLSIKGDNAEQLKQCKEIFAGVQIAVDGINELAQILEYLKVFKIPQEFIKIVFSIARGLDYYTGPVMETVLNKAPEFGSVLSGGRYDGLVKRFTGKDLPAVGASIGLDRLFVALEHLNLIDKSEKTVSEVLVLRLMPEKDQYYMDIADQIRCLGVNVETCLLSDTTFRNQFNFALSRGVKYVVICGEDEFAKNVIQIKNLETREQKELSLDGLADYFSN